MLSRLFCAPACVRVRELLSGSSKSLECVREGRPRAPFHSGVLPSPPLPPSRPASLEGSLADQVCLPCPHPSSLRSQAP
jgi:hypothetical protein